MTREETGEHLLKWIWRGMVAWFIVEIMVAITAGMWRYDVRSRIDALEAIHAAELEKR